MFLKCFQSVFQVFFKCSSSVLRVFFKRSSSVHLPCPFPGPRPTLHRAAEVTVAQHEAWEEEKKDDAASRRRYGETYSLGVRAAGGARQRSSREALLCTE